MAAAVLMKPGTISLYLKGSRILGETCSMVSVQNMQRNAKRFSYQRSEQGNQCQPKLSKNEKVFAPAVRRQAGMLAASVEEKKAKELIPRLFHVRSVYRCKAIPNYGFGLTAPGGMR